jgi:hypothetical protein
MRFFGLKETVKEPPWGLGLTVLNERIANRLAIMVENPGARHD